MVSTTRNDLESGEPFGFSAPRRISTAGGEGSLSPEIDFDGMTNDSCTPSPSWRAVKSVIAAGTCGEGGVGSPGAPQPPKKKKMEGRKWKMGKSCARRFLTESFLFSIFQFQGLQNVAAQILVLDDVCELLGDVGGVNFHILFLEVGRFKRNFVKNFFENGVQAPRADIFCLLVYACGETGDGSDGVLGDVQLDAFGFQERDVLLDERVLWLGKNSNEIFFLERLQFDTNGQAALKFRDQVGRFRHVKRAGRDEKNMVGADHTVASVDGRAFDDRQNVALHAFA